MAKDLRMLSNVLRRVGASDAEVLKTLHRAAMPNLEDLHESVQNRVAIYKKLSTHAENGNVALIESGMDCDCVRYSGHVHIVSSEPKEFWHAVDRMYDGAEGPIQWYIERPSVARTINSTSEDLILRAFEDGHPHVVYA